MKTAIAAPKRPAFPYSASDVFAAINRHNKGLPPKPALRVVKAIAKIEGESGFKSLVLFLPENAANYGRIECYAHVGQHSEASTEYMRDCKPATPQNMAKAGIPLEALDSLVREYETLGPAPEHCRVQLVRKDSAAMQRERWKL